MWHLIGGFAALALTVVAWQRSRTPSSGFYERDVYAMTARTHRTYAVVNLAFAAVFFAAIPLHAIPVVPLLAVFTVIAILYLASFVRGATGEDE
ncbi:MAG TPA: hypothetical protein VIG51_04110 [Candidatus Baltobacteraceae bacterium]|jgi:hypothetical protein